MKTIYLSYSRVSTNEQRENGVSIEAQIQEHQEWAKKHNVEISEYFQDPGYSAGSFKRPGLQQLLKLISKNSKTAKGYAFHYVILIRYQSRLIRAVTKKRSLQCVFNKYNVSVICLSGTWSEKPDAGGIVSDIQMLFDENERKQVSGRVIDSYRHIAMNGGYPIGGKRAPRGYKRERVGKIVHLVPSEEANSVREAFKLLATGEYTTQQACELFNAQGFLDKKWNADRLARFIDNPIYYGRLKTKYFDSDDPSISSDQKTGWYSADCHCEPLISRDLFNQVQKEMHIRRQPTTHTYYFDRKIRCSICGAKMAKRCAWRLQKSSGGYTLYKYYYCSHCNKRINESFVMEQFLIDYPKWERRTKDANYLRMLENKVVSRQNQIDILNELYEEGSLDLEEYSNRLKTLGQEIKKYRKELKNYIGERQADWNQFSEDQKMDFIKATVKCIYAHPGPIERGASIQKIQYRDDLPTIKKVDRRKRKRKKATFP